MRGKFITIEGQDGAGKSTNIDVIQQFLNNKGIKFVSTREPGGTPLGELLRDTVLNSDSEFIGDKAELLIMFAARAQHLNQVILPALERGEWVLSDRFTDATYAYQGAGRELGMDDIQTLEALVQGTTQPDLTLLLDLPVTLGVSRAGQRSEPDRFEAQALEFKTRVRECYLSRAKDQPQRIKVIDASQSLALVQRAVEETLEAFYSSFTEADSDIAEAPK